MRFRSDTVVVVTGSSRGLGFEYVKQILQNTEATVVATARNPSKSNELQALTKKEPKRLQLVSLDSADETSVEAAVKEVANAHSGVDLLINNAGIDEGVDPLWQLTGDTYRNILNVNVVGTFLVTRAFIPLLKKKPSRTIVNISSGLGSISQNRLAFTAPNKNPVGKLWIAYNASKAGLNMQTSVFANELQGDDFCIIALHPGWVDTDMGGGNARKLGMDRAPLDAKTSIGDMLKVIQGLSPKNSGEFLSHEGSKIEY